jgi:hypothetical protein
MTTHEEWQHKRSGNVKGIAGGTTQEKQCEK